MAPAPPSPLRAFWQSFSANKGAVFGLVVVCLLLLMAAFAPWLAPHSPYQTNSAAFLLPPFWQEGGSTNYLLGTDAIGRDILSRLMYGSRLSLSIGAVVVVIALVIGVTLGLIAGFYRGISDGVISGITNVLFAFPPLLLALSLASVFNRNWFTIAVAIAIVYVPIFIRVTRGPVLSLREIEYVKAATSTGQSRAAVMFRHVLPNITSIIIVQVTLSLSWAVLTEAALSFLGLGTPPPAASLGSMIFDARTLISVAPWTMIAPGVIIVMLVVGLNLLGDGLRDALDPRNRGKK